MVLKKKCTVKYWAIFNGKAVSILSNNASESDEQLVAECSVAGCSSGIANKV